MAKFEHKMNTGSLFKNDRKVKEGDPDRTGTLHVEGKSYYVNGWVNTGTKGQWLKLSVKPVDGYKAASPPRTPSYGAAARGDDDGREPPF